MLIDMGAGLLTAIGRKARWILAFGSLTALFLPDISSFLRPALPALVSMVLALAMARIDLADTLRKALRPARLALLVCMSILLVPVTALIYAQARHLVGPDAGAALVYLAAAPPIASSAGLCFLLGYNARLAVEITVTTTLLTPILGPLAIAIALPEATGSLSPLILARSLSLMIFGGILAAVVIRKLAGPARITRNGTIFDGIAAMGMLLFVFPLFDQVGSLILADPMRATTLMALACAFNLGATLLTRAAFSRHLPQADAGTAGIVAGNRTIAMYLAALPFDPTFAIFVALYQFPMYFTPLLLARRSPP